jgi:hypothetical protein
VERADDPLLREEHFPHDDPVLEVLAVPLVACDLVDPVGAVVPPLEHRSRGALPGVLDLALVHALHVEQGVDGREIPVADVVHAPPVRGGRVPYEVVGVDPVGPRLARVVEVPPRLVLDRGGLTEPHAALGDPHPEHRVLDAQFQRAAEMDLVEQVIEREPEVGRREPESLVRAGHQRPRLPRREFPGVRVDHLPDHVHRSGRVRAAFAVLRPHVLLDEPEA